MRIVRFEFLYDVRNVQSSIDPLFINIKNDNKWLGLFQVPTTCSEQKKLRQLKEELTIPAIGTVSVAFYFTKNGLRIHKNLVREYLTICKNRGLSIKVLRITLNFKPIYQDNEQVAIPSWYQA